MHRTPKLPRTAACTASEALLQHVALTLLSPESKPGSFWDMLGFRSIFAVVARRPAFISVRSAFQGIWRAIGFSIRARRDPF